MLRKEGGQFLRAECCCAWSWAGCPDVAPDIQSSGVLTTDTRVQTPELSTCHRCCPSSHCHSCPRWWGKTSSVRLGWPILTHSTSSEPVAETARWASDTNFKNTDHISLCRLHVRTLQRPPLQDSLPGWMQWSLMWVSAETTSCSSGAIPCPPTPSPRPER